MRTSRHRRAMQGIDVNGLFARAEQAFVAGRLDAARADLAQVRRLAGDHPAVLHLTALVEKKRGDFAAARSAFLRAIAIAPNDPQINSNYANLLDQLGDTDGALSFYDRALRAAPAFTEARHNRALLVQRLGRLEEALSEFDALALAAPGDAKVHSARGGVLKQLERPKEAAAAYDRALAIAPDRAVALHGRARVAMELGEPAALGFYRRALAAQPGSLELILGLAEALEADNDGTALEVLGEAVRRNPDWLVGHEVLARMRSEAGEAESFADHYLPALSVRPLDRSLHYSYWHSLARGERHREALDALRAAKTTLGSDADMTLMEGVFASEAGEPEVATRLFEGLGERTDILLARGRHALRIGDPALAARLLERVVENAPDMIAAWAHLSVAWRQLGDPRQEWLCEQPGLYSTQDLELGEEDLGRLAALLRTLHRTKGHPIGQSLRGGTQTRGRLFWRSESEIALLREAIRRAVDAHVSGLPARDDRHPLLRHRDRRFDFSGSWSVRLSAQGFHVNHIHPQGLLSSACYIALPPSLGSGGMRDGWLEIGAPPVELGLSLDPLASVEPRPGRLALFPSYLFHGTRPFTDGERLTVAFDVAPR